MKTILITGASSGIGKAVAEYLSSLGYVVILTGRNEQKLRETAKMCKGEVYTYAYDLVETEHIESIFSFVSDKNIKLDGLVHCAGVGDNFLVRNNKYKNMDRMMQISYFAFVELCKYFYKRIYSNEDSSIVVMSSLASKTQCPGACSYASAKSAVNTAVSVMSKEFIKRKIRVNAVLPAYVDTPMNEGFDDITDVNKLQPFGMIDAVYIAYLVEFLLSDKGKYITGAHISVSAGMEFNE